MFVRSPFTCAAAPELDAAPFSFDAPLGALCEHFVLGACLVALRVFHGKRLWHDFRERDGKNQMLPDYLRARIGAALGCVVGSTNSKADPKKLAQEERKLAAINQGLQKRIAVFEAVARDVNRCQYLCLPVFSLEAMPPSLRRTLRVC